METEIIKFSNYLYKLENRARFKMIKHHEKSLSFYNKKMINDILYNESTHYVEVFKEYLIYEDFNEFLKKYYSKSEIKNELLSTLTFYENNSKIYPNYTVIPESKYMYKNIKRKQKIIDQMQEDNNNKSNFNEYSQIESFENMTNTVFNSRVMNSIYNKSNTNRKDLKNNSSINTSGSITKFLDEVNNIEKNTNKKLNNNNIKLKIRKLKISTINSNKKKASNDAQILKNLPIELITSKQNPSNNNIEYNKNSGDNNNNKLSNGELNLSKKLFNQKIILNKEGNDNNFNDNNKTQKSKILNVNNIASIKSYKSKFKFDNCVLVCNNSLKNDKIKNNSNSIKKYHKKKSLSTNFVKQQITFALLKHKKTNSKNMQNYAINNINKKNNDGNLLNEKLFISTNSSYSPKIISNNIISSSTSQKNSQKKNNLVNLKQAKNVSLSKQINSIKGKTNILYNYNSMGKSINALSNRVLENQKLKNIDNNVLIKKTKNKFNEQFNAYQGKKGKLNNYITYVNKHNEKPETYRNFCHSKILSARNSKQKNNNDSNNSKNKYKAKSKLIISKKKNDQKNNNNFNNINSNNNMLCSNQISPNNSMNGFYYKSNIINNFNKNNKNKNQIDFNQAIHVNKTNINKNLNTNTSTNSNINSKNKNQIVNNYKIINNINNNTTQINIYTGKELYKLMRYNNNSIFNSSNILPSNFTLSGYPIKKDGQDLKKAIYAISSSNSININNDEKEKSIKLKDLKTIIHKQIVDNEKDYMITSERQLVNKRLFEKLGKRFSKNKNNHFNNTNNHFDSSHLSINDNQKLNKLKNVNVKLYNKNNNSIINKNINQRKKIISPDDIQDNDNTKITSMVSYRQPLKNKINKLKYFKKDDDLKFIIHSERNKINKIVLK